MGVEYEVHLVRFITGFDRVLNQVIAADVKNEARRLVRKDSRDLMNSIRIEILPGDRVVVSAGDKPEVPYALAQEYGLPKEMGPSIRRDPSEPKSGKGGPYSYNPYMRPAAILAGSDENIRKRTKQVTASQIRRSRI